MKPTAPSSAPVRVTCQVIRFWSAVRSENTAPSPHLENCPSCRDFFVFTQQLQTRLRQDACQVAVTPPPGMEGRIMEAIRFSAPPRRESHRNSGLSFALAGGAAALVCVGLWQFHLGPFGGHGTGTPGEYTADVAALVAAVRSLPSDLSQKIASPTVQLAQDNSLGREVENVYSDARSALDFLALNFLPASSTDALFEAPKTEESRQRT